MANILVQIDIVDGTPTDGSLGVLSEARQIATCLGATLYAAVTCGPLADGMVDRLVSPLAEYGADLVALLTDRALATPPLFLTHGRALLTALRRFPAQLVLLPPGPGGRDIGPRLALELGGLYAGQVDIQLGDAGLEYHQPLVGQRDVSVEPIQSAHRPLVLGLTEKARSIAPAGCGLAEVVRMELAEAPLLPLDLDVLFQQATTDPTNGRRRIAIGGGGGLPTKQCFEQLDELAQAMSGTLVASATACAKGLAPDTMCIGMDGRTVDADIYLAFGISGSPRHLAAISPWTTIIAVNNDDHAPIFEAAAHGLVADACDVIGELLTQLKGSKAEA